MRKLEYKDIEKLVINVFGINFNVNVKEYENIDVNNLTENSSIENVIDKVLGENASKKIDEKIKNDVSSGIDTNGIVEFNSQVGLMIVQLISELYIDNSMKPFNRTINKYNNYNNKIRNIRRNNKRYR